MSGKLAHLSKTALVVIAVSTAASAVTENLSYLMVFGGGMTVLVELVARWAKPVRRKDSPNA
jgi:hypothetical protein